jgi:hypothetical protein
VRKRIYASISVVVAALSMGGCFEGCEIVESHSLEVAPNPASVGQQVEFASRTVVDRGFVADVEFDLDGDGHFETHANPVNTANKRYTATVRRSYDSPRTIVVKSLVTAVSRNEGTFLTLGDFFAGRVNRTDIYEYDVAPPVTLQVQQGPNQPPSASFTVTPNPVRPGGQVTYDASESMDPDGQVVKYEWDLDNDGSYELDTGSSPTTTQMEPSNESGEEGDHTVGLRVTDDQGLIGTTTRVVMVRHPTRVASASKLAQRLPKSKAVELPRRMRVVEPGELMLNGDDLIIEGRIDRGRLAATMFPASLRRGKRKVRWLSSTDLVTDTVVGSGMGRGLALLRFPAGGRACMAFRVDKPARGEADGTFRVLGGVGRAAGLRGRGMGEGRLTERGFVLDGRLDLDFGGKRNFRLGKSDCAPLLRHARG